MFWPMAYGLDTRHVLPPAPTAFCDYDHFWFLGFGQKKTSHGSASPSAPSKPPPAATTAAPADSPISNGNSAVSNGECPVVDGSQERLDSADLIAAEAELQNELAIRRILEEAIHKPNAAAMMQHILEVSLSRLCVATNAEAMANGHKLYGRWPVADGRWPMTDGHKLYGRWPMAGGRWPMAYD